MESKKKIVLSKISEALKPLGFSLLEAQTIRDSLTYNDVLSTCFGHINGSRIFLDIAPKEHYGEPSFKTEVTPEIKVKPETFLFSSDTNILVKADFSDLIATDMDNGLHKEICAAITREIGYSF